jgi:transcriptional regulator PpsR
MTPDTPTPLPDLGALSPLAQEVAETMARVASDIALVIDGQGVIRNVAEGRSALQAGCTDWVGRRWVDTVTADTRPKIELLLDELQATGVTQRREVNHPAVDGDAVPVAWTAIRLGEGGPVVAVGRDLRAVAAIQRRFLDAQHEIELDYWQRRHADSRYQLLFQVASDAVLTLDAGTLEIIEANEAARGILGDEAVPMGGRRLAGLLHASARAAVTELLITARTSARPCEIRLRLADQGPAWDLAATPFRVGERQQLLLRARRHDEDGVAPDLLRSLVESTPDALAITDAAGHVVLANPAFVSLVQGGSESRIKGRLLTDVVDDRDGRWRDLIARTRLHGLCPRCPLVVTPGGLSLAVEVSSTLLAEGDQERLGFTLRTAEPAAAPADTGALDSWPGLWALRAQVGLVPLATLVRDASDAAERQFIHTALRLAGGQLQAAARMLHMEPQALSARLRSLQIGSQGLDDDVGTPPRSSFN